METNDALRLALIVYASGVVGGIVLTSLLWGLLREDDIDPVLVGLGAVVWPLTIPVFLLLWLMTMTIRGIEMLAGLGRKLRGGRKQGKLADIELIFAQEEPDMDRRMARNLRLSYARAAYERGDITEIEARELLSAPLSPGDPATFVDDSQRLRVIGGDR